MLSPQYILPIHDELVIDLFAGGGGASTGIEPEVYRVTWDRGGGWSQYHDERDPLPSEWDDEPPDEVRGFFSGDQMLAAMAQAAREERERLADLVLNDTWALTFQTFGQYRTALAAALRDQQEVK